MPIQGSGGYFNSLPEIILGTVKLTTLTDSSSVYSLPSGYFENFANNILQKIKSQEKKQNDVEAELEEVAPALNKIQKKNIYSLPENYFENLAKDIDLFKGKANVVSLTAEFKRALHYAVAASVLFVIASTSFLYVHQHTKNLNKPLSIEQRLATLNDDDIINYLKYDHQGDDISPASNSQDTQLQNLLMDASDEEIERYLDESNGSNEKMLRVFKCG